MSEKAEKKRAISTALASTSLPYTGKRRYRIKNGHETRKRLRLRATSPVARSLPAPELIEASSTQ